MQTFLDMAIISRHKWENNVRFCGGVGLLFLIILAKVL